MWSAFSCFSAMGGGIVVVEIVGIAVCGLVCSR